MQPYGPHLRSTRLQTSGKLLNEKLSNFLEMNYIRLFRPILASCIALLAFACSNDDGIDNRDHDYGYVQFKLYKAASYGQDSPSAAVASTRADELRYLAEATKINVSLRADDGSVFAQTLTVTADSADPEYGLRSEKLQLLGGGYQIISFELYDLNDRPVYTGFAPAGRDTFTIVEGGLQIHDLTVDVSPRGKVTFKLVKDGVEKTPQVRAEGALTDTFDEVRNATITVYNTTLSQSFEFAKLPFKFSIHFDENNSEDEDDASFGYQTSDLTCDSLVSLPAGDYRIESYVLYPRNTNSAPLVTRRRSDADPIPGDFSVADNQTTKVEVGVKIETEAAYIKDYKALKEIWEALDGEHWYYAGQLYAKGCNWDFNKDIDLWGDQPGIYLHGNGRVASIDISDFGPRGRVPAAIGQLTELTELYLGTHNDVNLYDYSSKSVHDMSIDPSLSISERRTNRMELNKQYLAALHQAPQMSEPCARALREHNIVVPETSLYMQGFKENEVINMSTGHAIERKDLTFGKKCNGITGIDDAFGNLTKLELLYIANGDITELPDVFDKLTALTDLEIYNCAEMKEFPKVIAKAPELISMNLSNNAQWSPETLRDGLDALASGASSKKIQLLYCTDCNLEEIPKSFNKMEKLGLLDMVNNKIRRVPPMPNVAPVQVYFDHNEIEEFEVDNNGVFCKMMDMETFSASYNKLTEFPNIFYSSGFTISSINLSMNQISSVPEDFKGIRVTTLTLTGNEFEMFPKQFINSYGNRNKPLYDSSIAYIVFRANNLKGFEEGAFEGTNSQDLMSLDLSYNHLTKFPKEFSAQNMPYLYGVDVSNNAFEKFPYEPFDAYTLTIYAVRAQRDSNGGRCLREWPTGVFQHTGLRGLYLGSNDLRKINDTISYLIYSLDISDNPNITFDASAICASWKAGLYYLIYDKTQNILNCEEMLQ